MISRSRIAEIIYQLSLHDQLYGVGRVWYEQLSEALRIKVPEELPFQELSQIFLEAFPAFVLAFPVDQPFFLVYYQKRASARERWLERNLE